VSGTRYTHAADGTRRAGSLFAMVSVGCGEVTRIIKRHKYFVNSENFVCASTIIFVDFLLKSTKSRGRQFRVAKIAALAFT
jgi:hypothetical protein